MPGAAAARAAATPGIAAGIAIAASSEATWPVARRRSRSRNSLLPSLSCTGDSTASSTTAQSDNSSRANAMIASTALCRSAGSRTTPRPRRTISGPHSNCGFTRHMRSPPASTLRQIAGRSCVREINEQSVTTRSYASRRGMPASSASYLQLTFSKDRTRSSSSKDAWNWPLPTSTASTAAAPWCNAQWLKPPVDAPISSTVRPSGTIAGQASKAAWSFSPPLET